MACQVHEGSLPDESEISVIQKLTPVLPSTRSLPNQLSGGKAKGKSHAGSSRACSVLGYRQILKDLQAVSDFEDGAY